MCEEVAIAVRELLLMQDPDFYSGGMFKFVHKYGTDASVCSEIVLKNNVLMT
jgi:hypothetical protein